MTLPKTLEKAVTKALKRDYFPIPGYKVHSYKAEINKSGFGHVAFMLYQDIPGKEERKWSQVTLSIADVIFDHGFLKAVYGDTFKEHAHQLAMLTTNKGRINYIGSTM